MSKHLLTKMLPRGVNLTSVGGAGKLEIGRYDVAAALGYGNLSEPAYHLGLAKYCDDAVATTKLFGYFRQLAQCAINSNKWQDAEKRADGLAHLMLMEGVFGVKCKACKGMGSTLKGRAGSMIRKDCEKCRGTGAGSLSQRQRGRIANVPSSSWDRNWKPRLEQLLVEVYDIERQLLCHLKTQFRHEQQ